MTLRNRSRAGEDFVVMKQHAKASLLISPKTDKMTGLKLREFLQEIHPAASSKALEMDELAKLQLENKKVRQRCDQLEGVEADLRLCEQDLRAAQELLNSLVNEKDALKNDKNSLKEKLDEMHQENQNMLQKLKENENHVQTIEELKRQQQNGDLRITELISESTKLRMELEDTACHGVEEIKKYQQQVKEAKEKYSRLSQENEELSECLRNADSEVQKLTLQNKELLQKLERETSELEKTLTIHAGEIQKKDVQIQKLNQKLSDDVLSKDNAVSILIESKELRKKNKELNDKIFEVFKENGELDTRNSEFEEKIKKLEENLEVNLKSNEDLKLKNEGHEKVIQELRDDLSKIEKSLVETTSERDELSLRRSQLEQDLQDVTTKYVDTEKQNRGLSIKLVDVLAEKEKVQEELNYADMSRHGQDEDVGQEMIMALRNMSDISSRLVQELKVARQKAGEEFLRLDLEDDYKRQT